MSNEITTAAATSALIALTNLDAWAMVSNPTQGRADLEAAIAPLTPSAEALEATQWGDPHEIPGYTQAWEHALDAIGNLKQRLGGIYATQCADYRTAALDLIEAINGMIAQF